MSIRRPEDCNGGPGLTPIDSSSPSSPTDRRIEPDRTTGRIPTQDDEDDARKSRKTGEGKKAGA
jgi:hypothetical protein